MKKQPNDITQQSFETLLGFLENGVCSSEQLLAACLQRIEAIAPLNAFISVDAQRSLAMAKASDARRQAAKPLSKIDGMPIAIKDMILSEGEPNTCASQILKDFVAPYDATVIHRLKEAGAILLGRTNMDEFAMGSATEHSFFGPCKNPWDSQRVPGGSSGGSAVAVATGATPLALGTDTGGSVRLPAAWTGCVGLKPSYGRISRYGVVAYASSLDQVGLLSQSVSGVAHLLEVVAGEDPLDATSSAEKVDPYSQCLGQSVKQMTLGIPEEAFADGVDLEIAQAVEKAIAAYEQLGVKVVKVSLPHLSYGVAAYYLIAAAEASSNLARYDGVRYGFRVSDEKELWPMYEKSRSIGFGSEVKRRLMLGTYILSAGFYDAYYLKAQKARTLICNDFQKVFEEVDALILPTSPAFPWLCASQEKDPLSAYLADIYTVTANLAGLCGISIPCGLSQQQLPIGLQLLAAPFQESTLLRLAYAYEQAHPWHQRRSPWN